MLETYLMKLNYVTVILILLFVLFYFIQSILAFVSRKRNRDTGTDRGNFNKFFDVFVSISFIYLVFYLLAWILYFFVETDLISSNV